MRPGATKVQQVMTKTMEKESSLQVPPSVLAEACRKWIFGGYLVTPDPRDAIHVTSRRPVTSPRFNDVYNFLNSSATEEARQSKFFLVITEYWSVEWGMSSGSETQLFHLNLKELEKNSVKFVFFHDNILIFAYFGRSKLKKGVKSGCGVSVYLSMWFTIQLI